MAASQEQKVDFLLKKIGYVASKTGIAEDENSLSGTKKAPFGEAIPSPLVVPSTSVWADSSFIPTTPPGATTAYVEVYLSGTSGHRMTVDSTVSGNRTFIAHSTYNNTSSSILGDWIDTSFSADYIIKVYKGDPNSGGVQLSAAGSGSNDTWFFDYSSGVLNFNGTQVPSGVTSSNIYIVGYRYIGTKGVQFPAGVTTATSLSVSGISTFTGLVDANGGVTANTLIVEDLTDNRVVIAGSGGELEDDANFTFDGAGLVVGANLNVSGISTLTGDVSFGSTATFGDNDKLIFGDDQDLEIFHNSSNNNTIIQETTGGNLVIKGSNLFLQSSSGEDFFKGDADGAVTLYYDDSKKFETTSYGTYTTGIASATTLSTGPVGTGINIGVGSITGPAEIIIDPAGVGDNTGTVRIAGDLQVDGTTVTLDTTVTEVDKLEVAANNTTVGVAITQSGTGDILNLYDGSTEVFSVEDGGRIVATATNSVIPFLYSTYADLPSPSTYHGAFAHVHATGKAYFAHAGNWIEIVSKETTGIVGTGTERYNVGIVSATDVRFTGVTTTGGLLDINGGGQANTFKVEDLTDNRIVIAGTGGELEDDANLTFDGSTLTVGVSLDVDGRTELDITNISETLNVTGISTFGSNVDINASVDISQNLNVTGISTFASDININEDLIVGAGLSVVGVSTFTGLVDINGGGQANTFKVEDLTDNRIVIVGTGGELEDDANFTFDGVGLVVGGNLNVSGIATFQSHVELGDSDRLRLGDGNDLSIYHSGSDGVITNTTGDLIITNSENDKDVIIRTDNGSGGFVAYIRADGSTGEVQLSHYNAQKFATKSTGIEVTGLTDTDTLTTGNATFTGTVSAGSSTGTDGQYLISTGVGVSWTTIPTARTTTTITAAEDQTSFPFTYNVGFLDVFYNGVKLADTEFTASNGTAVVLNDVAYAGDVVELISYATAASGGGGGGASNLNDLADVTITGSPVIGETLTHNGTKFVNDYTATTTTTATTQVSILSLDLSVYRSAEYQIQVTEGSNYHTTKILAIHNGTAASHNEYGTLNIGASTATFDVDISGSNLRLLATPASSNSTVFKVKFTGIKV